MILLFFNVRRILKFNRIVSEIIVSSIEADYTTSD